MSKTNKSALVQNNLRMLQLNQELKGKMHVICHLLEDA